jgi:hypothetical protein
MTYGALKRDEIGGEERRSISIKTIRTIRSIRRPQ